MKRFGVEDYKVGWVQELFSDRVSLPEVYTGTLEVPLCWRVPKGSAITLGIC